MFAADELIRVLCPKPLKGMFAADGLIKDPAYKEQYFIAYYFLFVGNIGVEGISHPL